ncbi:ATP-binding protein [Kineosporia succinea]|uniref:Anti-sigma regulatory factor (Ser/Thr protein kinase) n=1 Tax=Kineosporia succinea TaxID=84632 RepID=A0ABT9P035_9ACTN|nr:ATP-binding protein [Kineosporia succinea]MDP9826043.1 anti-sigma regulatory factor (Ser/Thr protein kinase) [Kineosporia succinea]
MVGVELRFPPAAEYVRTARLVAVAVARRAGLTHDLEELRLAVGEACARAVRRCEAASCGDQVTMFVDDTGPGLVVEVTDVAKTDPGPEPVALSLLEGLADRVEVLAHQGVPGGLVRLEWWPPPSFGSTPVALPRNSAD